MDLGDAIEKTPRNRKSVRFDSSVAESLVLDDYSHNNSPVRRAEDSSMNQTTFQLTRDDVASAFEFFDITGNGVLTTSNLKARLSAFYPGMTSKEYRFLLEDAAAGSAFGGSNNQSNPSNNVSTNSAPGVASGGTTAASGFSVDQLWELIDSFQRLYMMPAIEAANSRSSVPLRKESSSNHSNTPHRGSGIYSSSSGSPTTMAGSTHFSPAAMYESIQGFDPVREAFQVYDPNDTKAVDVQVLGHIMARIGFGELSEEELQLLVRTADFDQDGKITLDDFRRLVNMKGRFQKNGNNSSSNSNSGASGGK